MATTSSYELYKKLKLKAAKGEAITYDYLKLSDKTRTVAHWLIVNNKFFNFNWNSLTFEILELRTITGDTVAHYLAKYHPTWVTKNRKILQLKNFLGITVKEILIKRIIDKKKKDGS